MSTQDFSAASVHPDVSHVVVSEEEIRTKVAELAEKVRADYASVEEPLLFVAILKGAVMFMADFARAMKRPVEMEFMAISSYGTSTSSSGVVRIMKDLDRQIEGRHVLLIEDVVDSGLTLSWLLRNFTSRNPASLQVVTLFRKPGAVRSGLETKYVGFDIPDDFVVGYGLDYAEQYRTLPYLGVLKPEVYGRAAV